MAAHPVFSKNAEFRRKRWICWPNPDKCCLEGGCVFCATSEPHARKTLSQLIKYAKEKEFWPIHIEMS